MAVSGCFQAARRGSTRLRAGVLAAVVGSIILSVGAGAAGDAPPSPAGGVTAQDEMKVPPGVIGKSLPDAEAQAYDKKRVKTASFKGQPTLITFWATWCAPCLKEMPVFQKLVDESKGKFRVVAIAMQDQWDTAAAFAKKHPEYKFLFLHDPDWEADESRLSNALAVTALPTNVFVDAGGIVRDYWRGSKNEAELLTRIRGLLTGSR